MYIFRKLGTSDIRWVLTVPAIWNDEAKHFMRLAAFKVGDNYTILNYKINFAASLLNRMKRLYFPICVISVFCVLLLRYRNVNITCHLYNCHSTYLFYSDNSQLHFCF